VLDKPMQGEQYHTARFFGVKHYRALYRCQNLRTSSVHDQRFATLCSGTAHVLCKFLIETVRCPARHLPLGSLNCGTTKITHQTHVDFGNSQRSPHQQGICGGFGWHKGM
jgi:hypothetical protein